jgi:hypothetical protein
VRYSLLIETANGQRLHLVSYVSSSIATEELVQPSQDPALKGLEIPCGLYPETLVSTLKWPGPQHSHPHLHQPQPIPVGGGYNSPEQYIPPQHFWPSSNGPGYPPALYYPVQYPPAHHAVPISHHAYSVPWHQHQPQIATIPYYQDTTGVKYNKSARSHCDTQRDRSQGFTSLARSRQSRSPIYKMPTTISNSKSARKRRSPSTVLVAAPIGKGLTTNYMPKSRSTDAALFAAALTLPANPKIIKLPSLSLPSETTSRVVEGGVDARAIRVLNRKFTL